MSRTIITFALLLAACLAKAQTTIVEGVLADSLTRETEPFATLRIFRDGDMEKSVSLSVTDGDGHFSQEVKGTGRFIVQLVSVGKQTVNRPVVLDGRPVLRLDTLWTRDDAQLLQGVEVVAQKPLVKMEADKMTYSVEDDKDASAYTVLDMLRKVPMVIVDGQDHISVKGSSSFKVYVNGKLNAMMSQNPSQVFKAMPATAVKRIEVVTNPGARYDAEGTGGVLNLVMQHMADGGQATVDGLNGSLTAQAGNRSWGGGAFAGGQQKRFSFSVNTFANRGYSDGTRLNTELSQQLADGQMLTNTTAETKTRMPFVMGNLTMSYELDSMSSVGVNVGLNSFTIKNTGRSSTDIVVLNEDGSVNGDGSSAFGYFSDMEIENKQRTFTAGADYQRFFNAGRTSHLSMNYLFTLTPNETSQRNLYSPAAGNTVSLMDLSNRRSVNREHTGEHTLQADLTVPTFRGQTLTTGVKLLMRRAHADADYYVGTPLPSQATPALGMDYLYKNAVGAAYAEYEFKHRALGAKGGLRYEHTWQQVEYRNGQGLDFDKDYGAWVPSASVSYALAPTINLGVNYNMRISRPGLSYLNPYVDKSNPTALVYGNTDLDIEKTHTIAVVYNMFLSKFMANITLSHNFCNNGIEQYNFTREGILNTTYGNIVHRRTTGVSLFANWSVTPATRLYTNAGLNYVDIASRKLGQANGGWTANLMLGGQQTLPWKLNLGAFLLANTDNYTLQGRSSGFNMVGGNLTKSLLADRLSVSVNGVTGLSGGKLKFDNNSRGNGFTNKYKVHVPVSSISLQLQWKFGNQKIRQKERVNRIKSDYIEHQTNESQINNMNGF